MAKTTPYPPCTVTAFWLKYQYPARMLRRVTPTNHTAGPLARIRVKKLASRRSLLNFTIIRYVSNLYQDVAFAPSLSVNPDQHNYIPASWIDPVASQLYKITFYNRTRANGLSINIS